MNEELRDDAPGRCFSHEEHGCCEVEFCLLIATAREQTQKMSSGFFYSTQRALLSLMMWGRRRNSKRFRLQMTEDGNFRAIAP